MPSISFFFDDLCGLVGKKLGEAELVSLLDKAKAELDSKLSAEITVKYNDTNQPYLWSVEGLARHMRASLGKEKGAARIALEKSSLQLSVDRSVESVRPFIACFVAKGPALSEYVLGQLIQMQEKLADNFGRKREKVAIGLFPAGKVSWPLEYRAVEPKSVAFVPLGMVKQLTLGETLERHPKGKEFGHLLADAKKYPVVFDAKGRVVTLPPVVNSEEFGKLSAGDSEIACEVTGTDESAVNLVSSIFAFALADRGFKIHPVKIRYAKRIVQTPRVEPYDFRFDTAQVEALLGLEFSEGQLRDLLGRAQYDYQGNGRVKCPAYRGDLMHAVDVIEDIAIMYGYENISPLPLTSFTVGGLRAGEGVISAVRDLWRGFGYQEVFSPVLSNKQLLYDKMQADDMGTVEIENVMSSTYSCIRSWIVPILMDVLSKNRHVEYPQRLMEEGLVARREKDKVWDARQVAAVSAHAQASFTEMRQHVEGVMRGLGLECSFKEMDEGCTKSSFIPGRAAFVFVKGACIGFVGEIHPVVLEKFGLQVPVVACELGLDSLLQ